MKFSHPLARAAKVFSLRKPDGTEQRVLVVVTTLALDPKHKRHKPELVRRLTAAAQEFLPDAGEPVGFVLINRLRDWER
jgi:hypothetical protein